MGTVTVKKCGLPRPKLSHLEEEFALQLRFFQDGLWAMYHREYQFERKRRWKFDFCWPAHMVAVEIEGGIWNAGAHVRGKHFESDCEKYNAAALQGWMVGRFTGSLVTNGSALNWVKKALMERAK